jgi:hypothetical protein
MDQDRPTSWIDVAHLLGTTAIILAAAMLYLLIEDPYGRMGLRTSAQVPNLPERELMVSRALDPQFDSAIVGNSTSIPLQPAVLDRLTGRRFVSLSISGSGVPVALAVSRHFFRYHPHARVLLIGLDDSWCNEALESRPFPSWLYGNRLDYLLGLVTHASWGMVRAALAHPGANRLDGYHPYDETFREHDFDNPETVLKRLNRAIRRTQARYPPAHRFDAPQLLTQLISGAPAETAFVLLWTPRYLGLLPTEGTPAADEDASCKRQVGALASPRVRIVDWSGPRPDNLDPSNFYEPNHYRDNIAIKIEHQVADVLRD